MRLRPSVTALRVFDASAAQSGQTHFMEETDQGNVLWLSNAGGESATIEVHVEDIDEADSVSLYLEHVAHRWSGEAAAPPQAHGSPSRAPRQARTPRSSPRTKTPKSATASRTSTSTAPASSTCPSRARQTPTRCTSPIPSPASSSSMGGASAVCTATLVNAARAPARTKIPTCSPPPTAWKATPPRALAAWLHIGFDKWNVPRHGCSRTPSSKERRPPRQRRTKTSDGPGPYDDGSQNDTLLNADNRTVRKPIVSARANSRQARSRSRTAEIGSRGTSHGSARPD